MNMAYQNGAELRLPTKFKKVKPKDVWLISTIVCNQNNQILIQKRPESGLLASLWEFPTFEVSSSALQCDGVANVLLSDVMGTAVSNV